MTYFLVWLYASIGLGMAHDFYDSLKRHATWADWIAVVLVAIIAPIFFPSLAAMVVCKLSAKLK